MPGVTDLRQRLMRLAEPGGPGQHERPGSRQAQLGLLAALILVILGVAWWSLSDEGSPPPDPLIMPSLPIVIVPATSAPVEEASPSPAAAPQATPSARVRPDPGRLIAGLRTGIEEFADSRQVDRNAGKELSRGVNQLQDAYAAGDLARTWTRLEELAKKVVDLREEDRMPAAVYNTLTARLAELSRALPPRG